MKKRTLAGLVAGVAVAVMLAPSASATVSHALTSTPAQSAAAAVECAPAWSASAVYTGGDTVSYDGQNWSAQWWTQGETPGTTGQWGVWRNAVPCGSGSPEEPDPDEPDPDVPADGTPIEKAGTLQVCGTMLCGENGQPVQLRGMSTHGLQWYSQCITDSSLDALAYDWSADVIRLSTYVQEGGYETNPAYYTNLVHTLIEKAYARGMYVIADWHMLTPGDPWYNVDRAKTFFTEIAQQHGDKGTVLYEIANEPNGEDVSWSDIRSYAHEIIPVIRAQDPDGVVLVGTPGWSSLGISQGGGPGEIIANPVDASNVMYTFHFYAASHDQLYVDALDTASDSLPIFVTEFGAEEASGDGALNFTRANQYLDLMEQKNISWVKWNFSDDARSGAAFEPGTCAAGGPWNGASLKATGAWARDNIRAGELPATG
ncbi:cellulase family glycosylhydrolase [Microbacterium sp.]|uniref:cellulase family glycosylhydrolase n=1 Tax=Microbacterium sp. TaxID=51671 RepID=UPI00261F90C2|nr:cellulase family glycosylhydrolase [Microbacterium sp.]